jgi:hypothetical protein
MLHGISVVCPRISRPNIANIAKVGVGSTAIPVAMKVDALPPPIVRTNYHLPVCSGAPAFQFVIRYPDWRAIGGAA